MNKSPCFPFYPSDFFGDVNVRVMSPDAQAFYLLLLANIWDFDTQYSIPDDENLLSNLLRVEKNRLAILMVEIRPCFLAVKGRLISKRLKQEKEKQDNYRKLQSEKGKASAKQRLNRGSTAAQPEGQPKVNSSNPNPKPISNPKKQYSPDFEKFYASYPKRIGGKNASLEWEKLRREGLLPDIEVIMSALEKQKRAKQMSMDAGQFTPEWPDPERWIKRAKWEDEIVVHAKPEFQGGVMQI